MPCHDPALVKKALVAGLCAVEIGEYRVEYVNNAGPYVGVEDEHLALLERDGRVTDIIGLSSEAFESMVSYYGAVGVREQY